jgi:hypothetical protein
MLQNRVSRATPLLFAGDYKTGGDLQLQRDRAISCLSLYSDNPIMMFFLQNYANINILPK